MGSKGKGAPHDGGSVGRIKNMRRKDRQRMKSGTGRGLPKANVTGNRECEDNRHVGIRESRD